VYVLDAVDGSPPAQRIGRTIEYAHPYPLDADALRRALAVFDAWLEQPTW
jgi:hypothetical protein